MISNVDLFGLPDVEEPKKYCKGCGQYHALHAFGKEMGALGLRKTICKNCLNKRHKMAKMALKIMGDRPPPGYKGCPICDKIYDPLTASKRDFVPDHNHVTGLPRAWICRECNTTLGKYNDDAGKFWNFIAYIQKYEHGNDEEDNKASDLICV